MLPLRNGLQKGTFDMYTIRQIKRKAREVRRELKGQLDFVSVEKYLQKIGYIVAFFNMPEGDTELARHKLNIKAENTPAFTYYGPAKIVFIDGDISAEDKRFLLFHELGHIVLGHLDYDRMSAKSKYLMELEADTFAYMLISDSSVYQIL